MELNNIKIPSAWESKNLLSCCSKITDGTHDTPKVTNMGRPFYTAIHVRENGIDYDNCLYLSEEDHRTIYQRCNPERDDILMVNIGAGVCTTAIVQVDYEFSIKNVALLKLNKSNVNSRFLDQIIKFNRPKIIKSLTSGGAQPFLGLGQIGNLIFVIPKSKAEQEAIATALSDADAYIESLEKIISKKCLVKKGVMQELLTAKRRLPGFSRNWEIKAVDEFGFIVTGSTPSTHNRTFWNGEYPWITPTDINDTRDIYNGERSITKLGLSACRPVKKDSLLVTCIASIGKNAILKVDGACNQQMNAIIPSDEYNVYYLYYLLELNKDMLRSIAATTATPMISKSDFSKIIFRVPNRIEQDAIANLLVSLDSEIEFHFQKLAKARLIKQGMMQELLTGRIRLV